MFGSMNNFWGKYGGQNKISNFELKKSLNENRAVFELLEKYGKAGQATHDNII